MKIKNYFLNLSLRSQPTSHIFKYSSVGTFSSSHHQAHQPTCIWAPICAATPSRGPWSHPSLPAQGPDCFVLFCFVFFLLQSCFPATLLAKLVRGFFWIAAFLFCLPSSSPPSLPPPPSPLPSNRKQAAPCGILKPGVQLFASPGRSRVHLAPSLCSSEARPRHPDHFQ